MRGGSGCGGWLAGVILAVAAAGCGGGEDPLASPTVRPIAAPVEEEAGKTPKAGIEAEEPATLAPEPPLRGRNRPPRLLAVQVVPAEHVNDRQVAVTAYAEDPDGDDLSYRYTWWVNDVELEADGAVLSTRSLRRGDRVRVRVVATDGSDESKPVEGPVLTVDNGSPVIVSHPVGAGRDGVFRYQVRAEDPDGDRDLRYSLAEAPEGMTVSALGGLVQWRPRPDQIGVYPVEIVVEDGAGARVSQRFDLSLTPPGDSPVPAAPVP